MKKKTVILVSVMIIASMVFAGCSANDPAEEQTGSQTSDVRVTDVSFEFTLWNDGSPALEALKEYVQDVTDETSEHFIPKEDRIAAFDMDGTLYGEKENGNFVSC